MDKHNYTSYGAVDPVGISIVNPGSGSEFRFSEFTTLCDNISSNIYLIHSSASSLERAQKQIGTPADSASIRERIHNMQQKTNRVVSSTTQELRQLGNLARLGQKQHRLQVDRLRNEFHDTIQRYSTLQKQVAEKIKSVLLRPTKPVAAMSAATDWNEDGEEQTALLDEAAERRQAQKQLDMELEVDQALLLEREQRIHQIESDILDVNEIFRDLAAMVEEQGIVINTIEGNIENTAMSTGQGAAELAKAAMYQKKHRQKLCWLLLILLIVAIVIIIIIVVTTKK